MALKGESKYSVKDEQIIAQLYLNGNIVKDIISKFPMSRRTLYRLLKRQGVDINDINVHKRPKKIKEPKPKRIRKPKIHIVRNKHKINFSEEIQKGIVKQYSDGVLMNDLIKVYKMSKATFYRMIRRHGVEPFHKSFIPDIFKPPRIKPFAKIIKQQKDYPINTPVSARQFRLFNILTKSNLEETTLTFYEISDIIHQINIERNYNIGDKWKTRLSVVNYLRNYSEEIIDRVMYLIKHATIYEHGDGIKYVSVGEIGSISAFEYGNVEMKKIGYLLEFERNYWKYLLWINFRFNWKFRNDLNMMGVPLLLILSKEKSIQKMIYDLIVKYIYEMRRHKKITAITINED